MSEYNDEMGLDTWLDMLAISVAHRELPLNVDGVDNEAAFEDGLSPEEVAEMIEASFADTEQD